MSIEQPVKKQEKIIIYTAIAVLFLFIAAVVFARAMSRQLNHDEHYFVSNGQLLARYALLPYRDYAYTHMPNLIFVYALVFKFTNYMLFGARTFSVLCSVLMMAVLFFLVYNILSAQSKRVRFGIASSSVLFLLAVPLFAYTSGLAWNHDLPVLLLVLAYTVHIYGTKWKHTNLWNFASGVCIALAIGTRISFATTLIPFGLSLLLYPGDNGTEHRSMKSRIYLLASFSLGFIIGMLPVLTMFALAPKDFIFGNFQFLQLNTIYQRQTGVERMTLLSKLEFALTNVIGQPGNLLLFLSWIFFGLSTELTSIVRERKIQFESFLALMLVVLLTFSGLTPSPVFDQYFYDLAPFAILGIVYGIARFYMWFNGLPRNWLVALFVQIVILANVYMIQDYAQLPILADRTAWVPIQVHAIGVVMQREVKQGVVLTLSPLYPLEGGLSIYPEFATGPFIWRAAHVVPEEIRQEYGVLYKKDLDDFLTKQPPSAILVGEEADQEKQFNSYADQNNFTEKRLENGLKLWVP